jgi:hypothetical protein
MISEADGPPESRREGSAATLATQSPSDWHGLERSRSEDASQLTEETRKPFLHARLPLHALCQ